jgi:hypothetical protein
VRLQSKDGEVGYKARMEREVTKEGCRGKLERREGGTRQGRREMKEKGT